MQTPLTFSAESAPQTYYQIIIACQIYKHLEKCFNDMKYAKLQHLCCVAVGLSALKVWLVLGGRSAAGRSSVCLVCVLVCVWSPSRLGIERRTRWWALVRDGVSHPLVVMFGDCQNAVQWVGGVGAFAA